jgi:hypothetical protein
VLAIDTVTHNSLYTDVILSSAIVELPKVVVEWLTFLHRIPEDLRSNLSQRPVILIEGFRGLPQSLQANAGIEPYKGHDRFLPNPFFFHHSLSTLSFDGFSCYFLEKH